MPFLIIFFLIPLVEIAVFIQVGQHIGLRATLLLAFLTAILGGLIIRYQGLHTFLSARSTLRENHMPVREIFDGFCLVAAGALLITPGFVTDTIGFLLLIPSTRRLIQNLIVKRAGFSMSMAGSGEFARSRRADSSPDIIEGDFERLDEGQNGQKE